MTSDFCTAVFIRADNRADNVYTEKTPTVMHKSDAVSQQSSKRHRLQCSTFRTVCSHKVIAVGFNTLYYNAAGEITIRTNKKRRNARQRN